MNNDRCFRLAGAPAQWWRLKGGEIVMSAVVADVSKAEAALALFPPSLSPANGGKHRNVHGRESELPRITSPTRMLQGPLRKAACGGSWGRDLLSGLLHPRSVIISFGELSLPSCKMGIMFTPLAGVWRNN